MPVAAIAAYCSNIAFVARWAAKATVGTMHRWRVSWLRWKRNWFITKTSIPEKMHDKLFSNTLKYFTTGNDPIPRWDTIHRSSTNRILNHQSLSIKTKQVQWVFRHLQDSHLPSRAPQLPSRRARRPPLASNPRWTHLNGTPMNHHRLRWKTPLRRPFHAYSVR